MLRRVLLATALVALAMSAAQAEQVRELLPGGRSELSPSPDGARTGSAKHYDHTDSSHSDANGDLGLQARQFAAGAELSCAVPGGSDLSVTNLESYALPAGTRVKWQMSGDGPGGFFALIDELPAGQQLLAEGIVPPGATPGSACSARVI